ncbi:MAG: hypothetical protein R3E83_00385 [Burkholderiaceae bacterium]
MPSAPAPWAFASSTMWQWRPPMRSPPMVCNASPSSISMYTTAMAPRRSSGAMSGIALLLVPASVLLPHSGIEHPAPNLVALPMPAGTDGAAFRAAIESRWLPALDRFAPQFVFISAGFDGHLHDDMSDMRLVDDDTAG